jgi:aromatic ring-opening dioxygenase LigB subunit
MTLIGCFVTPHPPIIVPAVGRGRLSEVMATVEAMRHLGQEAQVLEPDTIVLLSPHAPLDPDRMSVGVADRYRGSLAMFGAPESAADLQGDVELAEAIAREAVGRGVPVRPLSGRNGVVELDHGSLVPLLFLVEHLPRAPRLVLLSFSFLRTVDHLEFGRAVGAALAASSRRVLYVASGDLSHRLTPDAPAGYSPRGRDFDDEVVAAFHQGDANALLTIPETLLLAAGECGYRSLVVLFGVLDGRSWSTRLLSYEGPFGVGYLVGAVDLGDGSPMEAVP